MPSHQVTCVTLGRHGDLLICLPAWQLIAHRTGHPVRVVVSQAFSATLEGASYVEPVVTGLDWIAGIEEARRMYPDALVPQFWLDPGAPEFSAKADVPGRFRMTINGRTFTIDATRDTSFDVAMWRRLGYSRQTMLRTPLTLDRRSTEREADLRTPYLRSAKPLLLVNLKSPSSPFTFLPEVVSELVKLASRFTLVDLSAIRTHRLYDLLGLYDHAAGLVTCDTSTLHLAAGSRLPVAAFTADGWRGSTPRGNCVWRCPYSEAMQRLTELIYVVTSWAEPGALRAPPPPTPALADATA